MTFDEYIKNPTGSAVFSNRNMYKNMYSEKWDTLKVRENGNVDFRLYRKDEEYFIHFKIPSEVIPKFYYDTVVKFFVSKEKSGVRMERTLSNYNVQFYSNDPSFVYTFAYSFKKNGLFINDLESKMSKIAIKEKAKEKNPKNEVGYVKSLYFAYLEMKHQNLFTKSKWEVLSKPYSKNVWSSSVTHADEKIASRTEAGKAILKTKKRENDTRRNIESGKSSSTKNNGFISKMETKSPNIPNFGKFKKTNFNAIPKLIKNKIGKK